MITSDPQRRVTTLAAITDILARDADPDDRDLLLSFAPVVFAEMPVRLRFASRPPRSPRGSRSISAS